MYNGIGLSTPRGSGTNGYVVRNLSQLKTLAKAKFLTSPYDHSALSGPVIRKTSEDIIKHNLKRQIEVKVLELQDALEESGQWEEEIILAKLTEYRQKLMIEFEQKEKEDQYRQAHEVDMKEEANERFRNAFGIDNDVVEGAAFRFEDIAKKKEQENIEKANQRLIRQEKRKDIIRADEDLIRLDPSNQMEEGEITTSQARSASRPDNKSNRKEMLPAAKDRSKSREKKRPTDLSRSDRSRLPSPVKDRHGRYSRETKSRSRSPSISISVSSYTSSEYTQSSDGSSPRSLSRSPERDAPSRSSHRDDHDRRYRRNGSSSSKGHRSSQPSSRSARSSRHRSRSASSSRSSFGDDGGRIEEKSHSRDRRRHHGRNTDTHYHQRDGESSQSHRHRHRPHRSPNSSRRRRERQRDGKRDHTSSRSRSRSYSPSLSRSRSRSPRRTSSRTYSKDYSHQRR